MFDESCEMLALESTTCRDVHLYRPHQQIVGVHGLIVPEDDMPLADPPCDNVLLVAFLLLETFLRPDEPRAAEAMFYALCLAHFENEFLPSDTDPCDTDERAIYSYQFLRYPRLLALLTEALANPGKLSHLGALATLQNVILPHYAEDLDGSCCICAASHAPPPLRTHSMYSEVVQRKGVFAYAVQREGVVQKIDDNDGGECLWDEEISGDKLAGLDILLHMDASQQDTFVSIARGSLLCGAAALNDIRAIYRGQNLGSALVASHSFGFVLFHDQQLPLLQMLSSDRRIQELVMAFVLCTLKEQAPHLAVNEVDQLLLVDVERAQPSRARRDVLLPTPPPYAQYNTRHTNVAVLTADVTIVGHARLGLSDRDCMDRIVPSVYNGLRMVQAQVWGTSHQLHLVYLSPRSHPLSVDKIRLAHHDEWASALFARLHDDAEFQQLFTESLNAVHPCFVLLTWNSAFHDRVCDKAVSMLGKVGVPVVLSYNKCLST
eukprot:m.4639 g.4639  ORF g.4639 m.4639 type:complete len:491 (+) comp1931_c0_seq1:191-1663(+)